MIIAWIQCNKNPLWVSYYCTNEVMRKHYVCRHTNLHAQTSRFHLYVNAPYVNKLHSTWGEDSWWAYADHLDTIWSGLLLLQLTTYQLSKSDNRQKTGNSSKLRSSSGSKGEGFWTVIWLDGSGAAQSKWFLTTRKLKWCVFLTYLLPCCCSDAAFIHSNFNLGLEDSINLWGCSQYKEDRKCWVV